MKFGGSLEVPPVGLIVVGALTIEKALDKAITGTAKVVKRSVDAATDEIASERQEALES